MAAQVTGSRREEEDGHAESVEDEAHVLKADEEADEEEGVLTMCESDTEQDPLPDFGEMSINRLRHWAEDVADKLYDYKQIKATLIINCHESRLLGKHGASYDETKTVLQNMIDVLETLTEKIKEQTTA